MSLPTSHGWCPHLAANSILVTRTRQRRCLPLPMSLLCLPWGFYVKCSLGTTAPANPKIISHEEPSPSGSYLSPIKREGLWPPWQACCYRGSKCLSGMPRSRAPLHKFHRFIKRINAHRHSPYIRLDGKEDTLWIIVAVFFVAVTRPNRTCPVNHPLEMTSRNCLLP